MNISALSQISYNRPQQYKPEVGRSKPLDDDLAAVSGAIRQKPADDDLASVSRRQVNHEESFGAYDYAKLYNPDETFDLAGRDSDPDLIDADGMLGSLRKDELMGQYQSLSKLQAPSARPTEDFPL